MTEKELPRSIQIHIVGWVILALFLSIRINKADTQPMSKDPQQIYKTTYIPEEVRYYIDSKENTTYLEVFYRDKENTNIKFDIEIEDIEIHKSDSIVEEERIVKDGNVVFTRLKLTKDDYIKAIGKDNYQTLTDAKDR